jgi:hypothetical protein
MIGREKKATDHQTVGQKGKDGHEDLNVLIDAE